MRPLRTIRTMVLLAGPAAALLLLASNLPAQPATPAAAPHARAELVADVASFKPGTPFTVAIVFDIDPKWHIYYKDPGDSGMAPSVVWNLPDGLVAGELQFPRPEVLRTPAGVNFVYHDKVALLVEMTPGDDFKIGRAVELSGALTWLECDADACLPAKQKVSLRVTAEERVTPNQKEQFEEWRAKVKEAESFDPADAARS